MVFSFISLKKNVAQAREHNEICMVLHSLVRVKGKIGSMLNDALRREGVWRVEV
jgi:hypothetical protein